MANDNLVGAVLDPGSATARILGDDEVVEMIASLEDDNTDDQEDEADA